MLRPRPACVIRASVYLGADGECGLHLVSSRGNPQHTDPVAPERVPQVAGGPPYLTIPG